MLEIEWKGGRWSAVATAEGNNQKKEEAEVEGFKALALNPCPWNPSESHVTYYLCVSQIVHITYNFEEGQENAYQVILCKTIDVTWLN